MSKKPKRVVDLRIPLDQIKRGQLEVSRLMRDNGRLLDLAIDEASMSIQDRALRALGGDLQDRIQRYLPRHITNETVIFFQANTPRIFNQAASGRGVNFRVLSRSPLLKNAEGNLGRGDSYVSSAYWEPLKTNHYSVRGKRSGAFFVDSGALRTLLEKVLEKRFLELVPDFKVEYESTSPESAGGLRATVTVKPVIRRHGIFDFKNFSDVSVMDRELQARLLRKLRLAIGKTYLKFQNPRGAFRPTVLILFQHWMTFVLPNAISSAVSEAINRTRR